MAKISAKEVVQDIKAGMDDTGLMAKYGVSAQGLRVLFRKLLDMGAITQAELTNRTPASDRTMVMAWHCPACGKPQPRELEDCPDCGIVVTKFLERQARSQKQEPDSRSEPESSKTVEDTPGVFRRVELVGGPKVYILPLVAGILLLLVLGFVVVESPRPGDGEALRHSAFVGDVAEVRRLLRWPRNAKNEYGGAALGYAASQNHLEIAQILLDKGANVNAIHHSRPPLIWAALFGYLEIVRVLLDKGADVNVSDDEGKTALIHASERGRLEVVDLLKARGARHAGSLNRGRGLSVLIAEHWPRRSWGERQRGRDKRRQRLLKVPQASTVKPSPT